MAKVNNSNIILDNTILPSVVANIIDEYTKPRNNYSVLDNQNKTHMPLIVDSNMVEDYIDEKDNNRVLKKPKVGCIGIFIYDRCESDMFVVVGNANFPKSFEIIRPRHKLDDQGKIIWGCDTILQRETFEYPKHVYVPCKCKDREWQSHSEFGNCKHVDQENENKLKYYKDMFQPVHNLDTYEYIVDKCVEKTYNFGCAEFNVDIKESDDYTQCP